MKNSQSLLAALFVSTLAFTSVACDDDGDTKKDAAPKDGAMADRTPDTTATEGGVDRTPDSTTEVGADKAPDSTTPDGGVDKAPDSTSDVPADVAADVAADKAPDQAVDLPADTTPDTTPDTSPDTADASTGVMLNGCTTYEDRTAAGADRSLTWDQTIATSPERCLKVKVGQSVTWVGNFVTHPLTSAGGDTPTPFPTWSAGTMGTLTFATAGTFGYKCTVHGTMTGAIWVVP